MGIPYYFKQLSLQHPETIRSALPKERPPARLFLDTNCALHQCAAEVLSALTPPTTPPTAWTEAQIHQWRKEVESAIIARSLSYLDRLVHIIHPHELVFVAIDGIAPRGKMQQQRKRRFMSEWETQALHRRLQELQHKNHDKETTIAIHAHLWRETVWTSSSITPGTDFMGELDDALFAWVDKHNEERASTSGPYFECSGHGVCEEGEHKIFAYMKNFEVASPSQVDVIYGLDADLIMLSMLQPQAIWLAREPSAYQLPENTPFLYMDISALRAVLYANIEATYQISIDAREYVALCFLLGNDFVPSLPGLDLRRQGHDHLLRAYSQVFRTLGQTARLVTSEGWLDQTMWTSLLGELGLREETLFEAREAEWIQSHQGADPLPKRLQRKDVVTREKYLLQSYPRMQSKEGKQIYACPERFTGGWRARYQTQILSKQHDHLAREYLRGLHWCAQYYFHHTYDPTYGYPASDPPLLSNLHGTCLGMSPAQWEHMAHPMHTQSLLIPRYADHVQLLRQLLCVLPTSSAKRLIPKDEQVVLSIMTDLQYGCVHFFPKTFSLQTYLRTQLWECTPVMPWINPDEIEEAIRDILRAEE